LLNNYSIPEMLSLKDKNINFFNDAFEKKVLSSKLCKFCFYNLCQWQQEDFLRAFFSQKILCYLDKLVINIMVPGFCEVYFFTKAVVRKLTIDSRIS